MAHEYALAKQNLCSLQHLELVLLQYFLIFGIIKNNRIRKGDSFAGRN